MTIFEKYIQKNTFGIWRYSSLYRKKVKENFRLYFGEGNTPLQLVLAEKQNFLFVKREDLNPFGSFKIRGVLYQICLAWQKGEKKFCISSTGNAGLASAGICYKKKFPLYIFLPKDFASKKKKLLKRIEVFSPKKVFFKENPTKEALKFSKKRKIFNLTPSLDKFSSEGFKSIGFEIYEVFKNFPFEKISIFSFSSSGSSFIGIGESFKLLKKLKLIDNLPHLYAIKGKRGIKKERKVKRIAKESRGGIIKIDKEKDKLYLKEAKKIYKKMGVNPAWQALFAMAGFLKEKKEKNKINIVILSGKNYEG